MPCEQMKCGHCMSLAEVAEADKGIYCILCETLDGMWGQDKMLKRLASERDRYRKDLLKLRIKVFLDTKPGADQMDIAQELEIGLAEAVALCEELVREGKIEARK